MARPIELGLVLEGKDAEEFWKNEKNPKVTDEQVEFFREAKRLYEAHPFGGETDEKIDDLRKTFQDGFERMDKQADRLLELVHLLDEVAKEDNKIISHLLDEIDSYVDQIKEIVKNSDMKNKSQPPVSEETGGGKSD